VNEIRHKVTIRAGRVAIENWTSYEIVSDMLEAADQFTIALGPADPVGERFGDVWSAVAPDSPVQVLLDDVVIMSGFIDDREGQSSARGAWSTSRWTSSASPDWTWRSWR
jgi:prophage tail gpP-like protein